MVTIGFLHHRKDPSHVTKSYAFASVAMAEGAQLIYFSPKKVNFETRTIDGFIFTNGNWQRIQHPFPDVIYNAGSPIKLGKSSDIMRKLREEIPFTTFSIGNKMRVYHRLEKAGEFAPFLIPSQYIHSAGQFFKLLNFYRKIVFKPVNGHKGQNIFLIEKIRDEYQLQAGVERRSFDYSEIRNFVREKIREELYLVQPFINCRTREGICYDIRMHVQKNGDGVWCITAVYPRLAPGGSIVSNINSGGATNYLEPFLKSEFGAEYYDIKKYLECFSIMFARHMDELQQKIYDESIDELGIDVALDDMKKIWIYEVNWRPGCPPAFYLELDVVKNCIRYALYLARREKSKCLTGGVTECP